MRFTVHAMSSSRKAQLTWAAIGAFRPRTGQRASRRLSRLSSTASMAPSWPESGEPASAHIHRGLALIRRELWPSYKDLAWLVRRCEGLMPRKGVMSCFLARHLSLVFV
ncbi:hypothetical protein V8C35DRAFT_289755 [Trichoderma chlorosporum]